MASRLSVVRLLLLFLLPVAVRAQETELLRGIVSGADKKPIEGVTVTVTGLTTQRQWVTSTNAKGLYTVVVASAEGEYVVSIRRIGYAPQTLHALRTGLSPVVVTNATLTEVAAVLDERTVTARQITDGVGGGRSVGGDDRDLLAGALFSLDPTDLLALAANIPGVMMVAGANGADSGYSVLGMGTDGNNTVVDGATTGSNRLPSMSIATASMATNTNDIMRGGFSGASMFITTRPGTDIFESSYNISLTNSHLTWADRNAPYQAAANVRGAMGTGGPIIKGKLNYFAALDYSDSRTPQYSLLDAPDRVLGQYGILPDTAQTLRRILDSLGVRVSLPDIPGSQVSQYGSASMRVDFRPKATTTTSLSLRGNWNKSGGPGYSALSFPISGTRNKSGSVGATLNFSGYVGGLLNQTVASVNYNSGDYGSYALMPTAAVRVTSVFEDGRTGLTSLRFGGGGGASESSSLNLSLSNELSILTTNSKHRFKIGGGLGKDQSDSRVAQLPLGSYSYLSLDDLAAGRASGYSRVLNARNMKTGGTTAFIGVQDEWLVSDKLQLSLGARTDFARPGNRPDRNPVVDSLFGMRNDVVPNSIGLIPRFGFSWTPTKGNAPKPVATPPAGAPAGGSAADSRAAMEALLASAMSGARVLSLGGAGLASGIPTGAIPGGTNARLLTFTGGISLQRGVISPSSIARLVDATGLPSTSRYMSCSGDATPVPVWDGVGDYAPTSCLDGSGPVEFTNARPNVMLYDPDFKPTARWSANIAMNGFRFHNWGLTASASYNIGVNLASSIDLNLRRDTLFRVAAEANRPVFVAPENILPASGAITPNAARIHTEFGPVSRQISDLQNRTLQFQFGLTPPKPLFGKLAYSINYTWVPYARSQLRGMGGGGGSIIESAGGVIFFGGGAASNTDGDPFRKEWAPGTQPTHTINASTSFRLWWLTLGLRLGLTSGIPYTPMVSGDINGDGSGGNDRAFVTDPSLIADPTFAGQMQSLLDATSPSGRDCLRRQFGTIAGRNSCRTPWQLRTDLNLSFTPPTNVGLGDRLKFTAAMLNAGSALVRITGLENSILGRSQLSQAPNSTLLYVTGFDPVTNRFNYRVNQLFGLPANYGSNTSRLSPFQVRLGAEWKIGGPPRAPMASGLGLVAPPKSDPLTVDALKLKLRGMTSDPVAPIMKLRDSLRLTPEQADSIQKIGARFSEQADSIFAPLAEFIAGKGKKLTDLELNTRLPKARSDVAALLAKAKVASNAVLTPAQKLLLPALSGAGTAPAPGAMPGPAAAPKTGTPPAGGTPDKVVLPPGGGPVKVIQGGGGGEG